MIVAFHGIVASVRPTSSPTTYRLTINITGLSDTYQIVVGGETWVGNYKDFPIGTVLTDLTPTITGYTLDPLSVASVTMDMDRTLTFAATAVTTPNYLSGKSPITLNGGLVGYGTISNSSGIWTVGGASDYKETTKYMASDGDEFFVKIGADTSQTFGLVDRYEIREIDGMGVYYNSGLGRFVVFVKVGTTFTDFPDIGIMVGHYLGFRFNSTSSTFTPLMSTDGVTVTTLTPPVTMEYRDFAGINTPYLSVEITRDTHINYPQHSGFILTA